MSRRLSILVRRSGLLLALAALPGPAAASEGTDLEAALFAHPNDVDLRLQYALYLARSGAHDAARAQAEAVIAAAPDYLDAYLLLGRIAGWQHRFDDAIAHVNTVLEKDPQNPEAIALKLDLLKWMSNHAGALAFLEQLAADGQPTADIYYRMAEAELARLQHLTAYRHAKSALRLDPGHQPSKRLLRELRRVTLGMTEALEYHGFKGEASRDDRLGMGLHLFATAFQNAYLSATVTESFVNRFRTVNNQVGLQVDYRPKTYLGFTMGAKLGAPAEVVSKGVFHLAVRGDLLKIMDATLATHVDILPWPDTRPALLVRSSLTTGFFVNENLRLGAAYTLGLLTYCGNRPVITNAVMGRLQWIAPRFTASAAVGYAEEGDPVSIGVIPPKTCEEINLLESGRAGMASRFRLVHIRTVHAGVDASVKLNEAAAFQAGYRFEGRRPDSNPDTIPTHITHLGLTVWF